MHCHVLCCALRPLIALEDRCYGDSINYFLTCARTSSLRIVKDITETDESVARYDHMAEIWIIFYDAFDILMLRLSNFCDNKLIFKFNKDRWRNLNWFCFAEIKIKSALKMAEHPSSELAAKIAVILAVINCQPKSCSRFVGTKELISFALPWLPSIYPLSLSIAH